MILFMMMMMIIDYVGDPSDNHDQCNVGSICDDYGNADVMITLFYDYTSEHCKALNMDTRLHPSCITGICSAFNMHPEIEEAPTVQMHLSTLQRLCTIKYQTLGEVLQGSVNFRFFTKYFLSMMMRVCTYLYLYL